MNIEYSNEIKGKVFAYRFEQWEKTIIAQALTREIKLMQKKIDRIEANPKNEGQATYSCRVDELRGEIKEMKAIIKEFTN